MATFEVVRHTNLGVDDVWRRLTDWERHGEFIPLTSVRLTGVIRDEVGASFVARTAVGPLHFDDVMEVTAWLPPINGGEGFCRIDKRGRLVLGWAELTLTPSAEGTTIRWVEEARFRYAGPIGDAVNRATGPRVFGRLVDGLLS